MTEALTVSIDELLAPATDGTPPAGVDPSTLPAIDEIRALRRDADASPGDLKISRKIVDIASAALVKSKSLQTGVWLLEALARVDGFEGAAAGFTVLRRLLSEFWDSLYPPNDPDDTDPLNVRRGHLAAIDPRLLVILKGLPLTGPPESYGLAHYEVTQKTGEERKAFLDGGWPSGERFQEALKKSPAAHVARVWQSVSACDAELAALEAVINERFHGKGDKGERVTFRRVKDAFETARSILQPFAEPQAPPGGQGPGTGPTAPGGDGSDAWSRALELTRSNHVDGLKLMQSRVADATSGRERFLRELQLAELALETGIYSLAFPVFEALVQTIDSRTLAEWEDKGVIARVYKGAVRCCSHLKNQVAGAEDRGKYLQQKLQELDPTQTPDS